MTEQDVKIFKKIIAQLPALYNEISSLSKKNPNEPLNEFKLNIINKLLTKANKILDDKDKPFDDFNTFDKDLMPTNSDVVVILSQYLKCLKKLHSENTVYSKLEGGLVWKVDGESSSIKAKKHLNI